MEFATFVFWVAIFSLAVIGCFSLPTLFAYWISKSRLPWLFQSLLIVMVACPLALVRAYDLMLALIVAGFLVLIGARVVRRRRKRDLESAVLSTKAPRLQLRLKDFVAAFVLFGIFAALAARVNQDHVWSSDVTANFLGVIQCVLIGAAIAIWGASLLVFRALRFRFWLPWLVVLAGSAFAAGWDLFAVQTLRHATRWMFGFNFFMPTNFTVTRTQSVLCWTVALIGHAGTMTLIIWLFRGRCVGTKYWTYSKKVIGVALVLLLFGSVACYYTVLLPPVPYSPKRAIIAGQPNSFPRLIEIATELSDGHLTGYPPVEPGKELANEVKKHAKTFEEIEIVLSAENLFWIDWNSSQFDCDESFIRNQLITIVRVLSTRALVSLSQERHDDVIEDGLTCFKLAKRVAVDGTTSLTLAGIEVEFRGVELVLPGIDKASVGSLKRLASHLDETMALYGTVDAELDRLIAADDFFAWNRKENHWIDNLTEGFNDLLFGRSLYDVYRDSIVRRNMIRELLRTEVAIALYRSENGLLPYSLEDLVPRYIAHVPRDRCCHGDDQPFQYVVSENRMSYQLYSFGWDRDDDSGKADKDSLWAEDGDLDLKVLYGDRLADNAKAVKEYEDQQAAEAAE